MADGGVWAKTADGWSAVGASVASAVGGGKVLQVVRATDMTGNHETTSQDFAPVPGMSITIDPKKPDSVILVVVAVSVTVQTPVGTNLTRIEMRVMGPAGSVEGMEKVIDGISLYSHSSTSSYQTAVVMMGCENSTGAAQTYQMEWLSNQATSPVTINNQWRTGQMFAIELEDVVVSP